MKESKLLKNLKNKKTTIIDVSNLCVMIVEKNLKTLFEVERYLLTYYINKNYNSGYLYCLHNKMFEMHDKNTYKLGCTGNIEKRLASYCTNYFYTSKIEHATGKIKNCFLAEKVLFKHLDSYRLLKNREFFSVESDKIKNMFNIIEEIFNNFNVYDVYTKCNMNIRNIEEIRHMIINFINENSNSFGSLINVPLNQNMIDHIIEIKVDEIINADDISCITANKLVNVSHIRRLTNEEQIKLHKYIITKQYHIRSDIDKTALKDFYIEIKKNNYYEKVERLLAYYYYIHLGENYTEHNRIDKATLDKISIIDHLLKLVGFTGILDESTIEYKNTDIVPGFTDLLKNKIREIFSNDNDCGKLKGQHTYKKVTSLLCRITSEYLGITIHNEKPIDRKVNGSRYFVTNMYLKIDPTIMDYFYIGLDQRHLNTNIKMLQQRSFKRTEIHNLKGLYEIYIKNKIDMNTKS